MTLRLRNIKKKIFTSSSIIMWVVCFTIVKMCVQNRFRISKWSADRQPDNSRIFFHETSGRNHLNIRQTCAVESTAKENPHRPIQLFIETDHVNYSAPFVQILQQYDNVEVILVDANEYFKGTILQDWYQEGEWKKSPYRTEHFSDYIRMLSLFKGGGMYMDLDFVVLRTFDDKLKRNFFSLEDSRLLSSSAFHLEHGHRLAYEIVVELALGYNPEKWSYHGPAMLQRVLKTMCNYGPFNSSLNECSDVQLNPYSYFYPYHFSKWQVYFENTTENAVNFLNESYAVHVWNKLSHNNSIDWSSNQLYAVLASEHCPLTVTYSSQFR